MRSAYLSMEVIGWFVVVPFGLATLAAGLVESLGTPWGLFRHWWVLVKFLLTTGATIVLLRHMSTVTRMAGVAADKMVWSATDFRALQIQLVIHAGGGCWRCWRQRCCRYKWRMTPAPPYGLRKQHERRKVSAAESPSRPESDSEIGVGYIIKRSRCVYVVGIHAIGLALLFLVVHLTGGGLPGH